MFSGETKKREERSGIMEQGCRRFFLKEVVLMDFAGGNERALKKMKLDGEGKRLETD